MKPAALLVLLCAACSGGGGDRPPVGSCETGAPDGGGNVVTSPAPECRGDMCLRFAGVVADVCSMECTSYKDCESLEWDCAGGFSCVVAVTDGEACCKQICVCRDYLPVDWAVIPAACDPANPANACCNLEGRQGDAAYPDCR
jgi:hypothetical protein